MKKTITLLLLAVYSLSSAQQSNVVTLSLKDAIDLGIKNSNDLLVQGLNASIAENDIAIHDNNWLPDITLNGSVRYNTQLQKSILPEGFNGSEEQQSISFGTRNSTSFSLDVQQNLVNSDLKYDKQIEEKKLLIEKEKLRDKKNNIAVDISEAYLNVILKEIQFDNAKSIEQRQLTYFNIVKAEDTLQQTTATNLLQAKINYQNAKYESDIAHLELNKSKEILLSRLNLEKGTELNLSDDINTISAQAEVLSIASDTLLRAEITELNLQKEISEIELDKLNNRFVPNVSFVANYTALYQSDSFNYFGDYWSPFNYVGVQASLPVSDIYKDKATKTKHQLTIKQYDYDIANEKNIIEEEIKSAKAEWEIAKTNMRHTKETFDLTSEIYEQTKKEFELGVLLYDQVLDKEKTMLNTQINYMNSVYNYLLAKLNYDVAIGLL